MFMPKKEKDHERYCDIIIRQIFEGDGAFFLESGIIADSAKKTCPHGTYARLSFDVNHEKIKELVITLEASDLYTVTAFFKSEVVAYDNVITLKTRKPFLQQIDQDKRGQISFTRVFSYDLIEVLWAIFYRDGKY